MPDRLEREIDEILRKVDSLPEARKRLRPGPWQRFKTSLAGFAHSLSRSLTRLSVGHLMIVGFGLMVAALIVGGSFGTWGMIAGLVVLLTGFAISISRGRRPTTRSEPMRWRGRVIEMDEPSLGERVRGLWRRKKH
jgi:hypothetical protein